MGLLATRMSKIKPSPTLAVTSKAAQMRSEGLDVIGLGAGEPDFDTPDFIKRAAIEAINAGKTKYTPAAGTKEMKEAIIQKFKRDSNIDYAPENIVAGAGGKQVLFNAFMATLDAGDEVIIPAPYWVSYPTMVEMAEGIPVFIECPEENDFKLKAEHLEKAITDKTKWIIINSPNNPTGAALSEEELREIADVLLKHPNIFIISDDIYEHIVFGDFKFRTIVEVEPTLKERTLIVNGVSKAYSMTGWRLGYGAGPAHLIKAMSSIQSHSTSNPSSITQEAAIKALTVDQGFLKENAQIFERRRDMVVGLINKIEGLECKIPEGAFYVFPSCRKMFGKKTPGGEILNDSVAVAKYLLEDALVAVVPGIAFGMEGFLRISYATSEEALKKAIASIKIACEKLNGANS